MTKHAGLQVLLLVLQYHLVQKLSLHLGLLTHQRPRLPGHMIGLETKTGRESRTGTEGQRTAGGGLTSVCWDLDREARIWSRMRSDRSEATFSWTSLETAEVLRAADLQEEVQEKVQEEDLQVLQLT